ncbi:MAG: bacteriohemerythrin [Candidatus Paceibacterota bacterium]|jgi:hemerythrin-like metal-binding protein
MKDLIIWDDTFTLGVAVIDEQHKKMIGIINELYHAMKSSTEKENLSDIITELTEYADYHFTSEESFFDKCNYPGAKHHRKSHELYRETINNFLIDYHNDESVLPLKMIKFLGDWWSDHIRGEDRDYVLCFHACGLK